MNEETKKAEENFQNAYKELVACFEKENLEIDDISEAWEPEKDRF